MKILITGATGFLGSHLCRRLNCEGHEVTIFRRPTSNIAPLRGLELNQTIGDITDAEALNRAIKGQEVVVHAAAHLAYWGSLRDLQTRTNVEGSRNVATACSRYGVKRLLHVSSVAAIGIPSDPDRPADEAFPFNLEQSGLNYHISKWRAEQEVLKQVADGMDAVIVNPGSLWGPFGNRVRGSELIENVRRHRVVPYFQGGMNVVHVDDVVDGIMSALRQGRKGERYILGGENLTFLQIAELAALRLRLRRTFIQLPSLVTGVAAMLVEPTGRFLGKRPRITYEIHYCSNRYQFYASGKARSELEYHPRLFKDILEECVTAFDNGL